jgi:4-hydroxy-3-methylbut-2-en-1-yl diphosphate reductase
MIVNIDKNSGFCFGVVYAIEMAEEELKQSGKLYCLGDIVHNNMEVQRLTNLGMEVIDHQQLSTLHNCKVLIRAHGEPPQTYQTALQNNIQLIDASCPVVLKLQNRIREEYETIDDINGQIVIFGKDGHAEVNGLKGQTNNTAVIVNDLNDLDKIDYSKPIRFFSQTTQPTQAFKDMRAEILRRVEDKNKDPQFFLEANDTLCRQVSNREPQLRIFAAAHDVIVFVSGKKSSNGKILHDVCKEINAHTYFVSENDDVKPEWFTANSKVGICGATSTPMWHMEEVATLIQNYYPN